ncbi:hypothetical protein D0Y65_055307 [Glycine soja]|uniref:Uncharacterized protein n=1 Tax=Glycine soja TaxID=3848 RepID=A0A445EY86_GLYSO|nr:hypothetical protein D0Y65_055307 [Glycine soja]
MMRRMGFHEKWIGWIKGCLSSTSISILVNGSPTSEFKPQRGLRQGDPLAPFLFDLVAEGLTGMMRAAVSKNCYHSFMQHSNNVVKQEPKRNREQKQQQWRVGAAGGGCRLPLEGQIDPPRSLPLRCRQRHLHLSRRPPRIRRVLRNALQEK